MHAALAIAKQRRYVELQDGLYEAVFQPQPHGGNQEQTCSVCGEEGRQVARLGEPDDPDAGICALCRSFWEEIGRRLPEAQYVTLGLGEPQVTKPGGALEALRAFGLQVSFSGPKLLTGVERIVIWRLDDGEIGDLQSETSRPIVYEQRYIINLVPRADFNGLQEEAAGISRLGVLRMDLDDAGRLFKDGFGRGRGGRVSLARLATLSFQISLFFEGWIKRVCQREEFRGLIYAVYAGGDDLFLIGPWDLMPGLAQQITDDLVEYAGGNPDVHLSGGLAFIHGKYPVYQAAEDAGNALELAKGLDGKNALAFLGRAWKWNEFAAIDDYRRRLTALVTGQDDGRRGGPQALLQLLRQLAQQRNAAARGRERPVWGPWLWLGPYMLTRMAERAGKENQELARELSALRDEFGSEEYAHITAWGTAARWAQLLLRKKSGDE
jgi:CRISPR-associated protein Csm1